MAPSSGESSSAIPIATLARCGCAVHCDAVSGRALFSQNTRQGPRRRRRAPKSAPWNQFGEFPLDAGVLRTSSAITGVAPHGRLVTKRSVPSLASNARPAWFEPPRYWPQERGTVETHCVSPNCGMFALPGARDVAAITVATIGMLGVDVACGFPALSATVAHPRIARVVTAIFEIRSFIVAPFENSWI